MTSPSQLEALIPDETAAQSALNIAPHLFEEAQMPENDTVHDDLASAKDFSKVDENLPSDLKNEALPGTTEPNDPSEMLSKEAYHAVEKLYDFLKDYIGGNTTKTDDTHHYIGLGSRILRRHERLLPLKARLKQHEVFAFMIQAYFRLIDDR
jgi:hypothetical protein